jgi:hypothetical protein
MASVRLSIWSRKQVKDESPFSMNPITLKRRRRRARLPIFLFNAKNKKQNDRHPTTLVRK